VVKGGVVGLHHCLDHAQGLLILRAVKLGTAFQAGDDFQDPREILSGRGLVLLSATQNIILEVVDPASVAHQSHYLGEVIPGISGTGLMERQDKRRHRQHDPDPVTGFHIGFPQ
jgi:hypothetical protein